jgi:midasin
MVHFNESLARAVVSDRTFGRDGAPWEFNLRDVLRWCELAEAALEPSRAGTPDDVAAVSAAVVATFPVVYLHRMRTAEDRAHTTALFAKHFGLDSFASAPPVVVPGKDATRLGVALLRRGDAATRDTMSSHPMLLLREQLPPMEAAAAALARGWMAVLVGPAASGKTVLARSLALLAGAQLHEVRALSVTRSISRALEVTKERNTLLCPTRGAQRFVEDKLLTEN